MDRDTIVAPITALVNAPVITLRVSGRDALKSFTIMQKTDGASISDINPNVMSLYRFIINKSLSDDVMAVFFKSPKSFTGEDVVEISFHGNPIIVKLALEKFYSLGFRAAEHGEFSKRAFLNGKIDLSQAEAIQEMISAKTEKGLKFAHDQLKGVLSSRIEDTKNELLSLKSLIEAEIDFSDQDDVVIPFEDLRVTLDKTLSFVSSLLDSYKSLRISRQGVSIVLAGKPNVGKSSLLNALLKTDRAIVSPTPGTTRDYIKEELYISNLPIKLIDTAGVRTTSDEIESSGVDKTISMINDADIVIVVLDTSNKLDEDDKKILALTNDANRIIIGNKSDLPTKTKVQTDINVSAKNLSNIDELTEMIKDKVGLNDYEVSSSVAAITERHAFLLEEVKDILARMSEEFAAMMIDMVALDLDRCISLLEEITGERYTEKVLDMIFSKFCIGK